MRIENLLIGGNSFTQDGVGGCPPTSNSMGGCSFIDQGQGSVSQPASWAGMLAQRLHVQSLVNMAAASHGNILIAESLRSVLERYQYPRHNTLIMFNISIAMRLDVPCEFDNPAASPRVPWNHDLCAHTYLHRESRQHRAIERQVGLDIVPGLGYSALDFLFNYLENRGYVYAFMLTEHHDLDDTRFQKLLQGREDRMLELTPGPGLHDFATKSGYNTENGYHPDATGKALIVDQILEYLSRLGIQC
jgi:hypothetical protein